MAILTDTSREKVWAKLMRRLSNNREPIALSKTDLRAAVDAADSWADANSASYNSTLPAAAQTDLTAPQKAEILMGVITERFEVS